MSTILDGEVTRPASFDATKDYALVIARGDDWLGDYDVIDAQRILRQDLAVMSRLLFREGAVLFETGGTIGTPAEAVVVGGDQLGAAGEYVGLESQLYTVKIAVGGVAGTATFTWSSTGADNPPFPGEQRTITAIAPDLPTALADLATYGHAVGMMGLQVVFVNATGALTVGNTWVVEATYGARSPVVAGTTITVSDLLIPVEGRVHRVAGATLTYPPAASGVSIVYAEWTRSIVSHTDDANLVDPLSDTPQAWRERWRVVLRTSDTSANPLGQAELERRVFPIYQWDRGTDAVTRVVPNPYAINIGLTEGALDARRLLNVDQNELLRGVLARHTGGPHGSFVVAPLGSSPRAAVSTNAAGAGKIRLAIPSLVAFVEGLEIRRADPSEIEVDQATDFASVADEPHQYQTGTNLYQLNKAAGDQPLPIKAITKVTATVQIGALGVGGYEAVTRAPGTDFDSLANTNLVSIERVSNTQGGPADYNGPNEVGADDYEIVGNQIHWIGNKPADNDAYYVVYRYRKQMVAGVDYQLATDSVDFSPAGDDPVNGTSVEVDYDYYLNRIDAVVVRTDGSLAVIRGRPAEEAEAPVIPLFVLPYVQVTVPANSLAVRLEKFPNDTVTMERLNQVLSALEELTINVATQDLVNQARVRTTGSFLDIFAEAFATLDLADLNYNVGGHVFDATIDTEKPELTLPFTETLHGLTRQTAPVGQTDVRDVAGAAFWTIPYTDELAIDAPKWSVEYKVNPFADFRPEPPLMTLDPSRDEWVDTTTINTSRRRTVQNGRHIDNRIVARRTEVQTRVTEIPALYMRQIPVKVAGFHFVPGEKVRCQFNAKEVNLTAVAPTNQGGDAFTVLAGADGAFTATLVIPAQVPNGTVAVELYGDQGQAGSAWPGSYSVRARATFTSAGLRREVAIETTEILVRNDPIAQSFLFPAARMVSKIDVPLAAKPSSGTTPLIFELRATDRAGEASTPVSTVLARQAKAPAAINVGLSSVNEFVPPDPVMCFPNEFRALVLRSASNAYRAYVAQLGQADRVAGGTINVNQIDGGIFLESSNNADWTLQQGWDLRFRLWVARMSASEARLYLNRVTQANTTGFYLAPDQVVPDGTAIVWQYSTDGLAIDNAGKLWTTFDPFTVVELPAVAGTIDLRALLRTTDLYVTPAINKSNLVLQVLSNQTTAKYISKRKVLTANTTKISGGIEVRNVAGGTTDVLVSLDNGSTWTSVGALSNGVAASDGYTAYRFDATGLPSGKDLRVRVDQSTPNRALRPRARRLYAFAQP